MYSIVNERLIDDGEYRRGVSRVPKYMHGSAGNSSSKSLNHLGPANGIAISCIFDKLLPNTSKSIEAIRHALSLVSVPSTHASSKSICKRVAPASSKLFREKNSPLPATNKGSS